MKFFCFALISIVVLPEPKPKVPKSSKGIYFTNK